MEAVDTRASASPLTCHITLVSGYESRACSDSEESSEVDCVPGPSLTDACQSWAPADHLQKKSSLLGTGSRLQRLGKAQTLVGPAAQQTVPNPRHLALGQYEARLQDQRLQ